VDPLGERDARGDAGARAPRGTEALDLRQRADDAGEVLVEDGRERLRLAGHDQVQRSRPKRGADDGRAVAGHPQARVRVPPRLVAQRRREAEHQVVARLVREQERPRDGEEPLRRRDRLDFHATILERALRSVS
jgi:hypothetical protein